MRRDVAPEDRVEQLTLTESGEATDDESVAYVSSLLGTTPALSEPSWFLEAWGLPVVEQSNDDEPAVTSAPTEPEWVEELFERPAAAHPTTTARQ